MKSTFARTLEWCMRRWILCVLLLSVGCRAQSPSSTELNHKVENQIRATFNVPVYVDIAAGERKPSTEFPGYDALTVKLTFRGQEQTLNLLLSKDERTLLSVKKMDLTRDPLAETMAKIDLRGRPVRGNKDAKLTLVVYDDFQCPYCSNMHQTLTELLKTYGDRVKVVYKDFPLVQIHPWAMRAAIDSECLARQGDSAFWDFADYVHANGRQIQGENHSVEQQTAAVDRITLDIGKKHAVNQQVLEACVKEQPKAELEASIKEAEAVGVEATPAIFVNGLKLDGALPAEEFALVLDKQLKEVGVAAPAKADEKQTISK